MPNLYEHGLYLTNLVPSKHLNGRTQAGGKLFWNCIRGKKLENSATFKIELNI